MEASTAPTVVKRLPASAIATMSNAETSVFIIKYMSFFFLINQAIHHRYHIHIQYR